jgi:uncharacterized caspase-like protein
MRALCTLAVIAVLATPAFADEAIATYAIVVGSNTGGPGQADLRYAEDDARRVGTLLTELGGYKADQVDVIVHPTPDQLRARIGKLGEKITADAKAGRLSRVFFYYSGHARAEALDLGKNELPLVELRSRLFELPAKLTVVVLDACQSGAFSRVKGAAKTADFSFNSRTQLDATGVAVLASSSGSELSQESEQLKGSYFTHHLLVGLRGASDANHDGLVTVDEAYRYAYHQTLLATAETAVGGQHVSLEVDLKGHGDVPLSFPRAATKSIELPASMEGKALVEDTRSKTVVAETYKAKGASVRIAVAPGEYRVLVRQGTTLSRCEVSAGGVVELSRCSTEALVDGTVKGGEEPERPGFPMRFELGGSIGGERHDAYTDSLEAFGYHEQDFLNPTQTIELTALYTGSRVPYYDSLGLAVGYSAMPSWQQDVSGSDFVQRFDWSIYRIQLATRLEKTFARRGFFSHVGLYVHLAAGLGIGRTTLTNADSMRYRNTNFGLAVTMGVGLHFDAPFVPGLGFNLGWANDNSPVIEDLIGNTHNAGGNRVAGALTFDL